MVTQLSIYRRGQGELFYRLSPTAGRTSTFRVEAVSADELDRWLAMNGYVAVIDPAAS
jgi:hypothetical protein